MKYVMVMIVAVMVCGVGGQTTAPSTQPAGDVLPLIIAAVKAGNHREAIKAGETYLATFPKGKMKQPEQAATAHCIAVSYFRLNQPPKAREWMDKAWAAGFTSKSMALNRAIMDIKLQGTLVRGMKQLESALPQYGVDEISVDALGYAISQGMKNSVTKPDAAKMVDSYTRFNTQLEATKPGQKHYGNQWMTADEYQKMMNPRLPSGQNYQAGLAYAVSQVERCKAEVNKCAAALAQAKREAAINGGGDTSAAQNNLSRAQADLKAAQQSVVRIEAMIPQATFAAPVSLYDPEPTVVAR